MAETAVSLAGQHALPKILEAVKMLRDLPKEVRDITDELESFQDFINDADKVAEAEEDDGRRHRIKERVMRLREAAFRMEDVIDEYNISCEDKQPDDPRCAALLCEAVAFIKTQILLLQSAYKIQDVKSLVRAERDGIVLHFSLKKIDGDCPEELKDISLEIVRKCKGLPLAIVAIGGLLSQKDESAPEWGQFSRDLSLDLERNSELNSITKILGLSYDDLPINLRSCLLYFGMYPEDYEVQSDRLIRQWIAEGFVKHETGKTLEEVAHQYLSGLVRRSLVQVSSFRIGGKVRRCRVHDLIHDMILRKVKDTGFCQYIDWPDQSVSSKIVRRLTIATHDFSGSIGSSPIRSILIMTGKDEKLSQDLVNKFPTNYMLLKVLDFEGSRLRLRYVPENLGNLCHLKYLSFRYTWIESLPKSIGKLQNLETLDIRGTHVSEMPKEITKLTKLRHLLSEYISLIQWKDIGGMTSLQEIPPVIIDDDGVVIGEVGKLKQLRELTVRDFEGKHKETLCSLINEMPLLEKLDIYTADESEVIDLYITSPMSTLRKLVLWGTSTRLTNWISQFPNLVQLCETLHFHCGGFQKLKQLSLGSLDQLKCILIDRGALCSVEEIVLEGLSQLKTVPSGIQHLEKLKDLYINCMPTEFEQRIAPDGGEDHWIIQDVPHVRIWSEDAFASIRQKSSLRCVQI
ncbi:Disease resistance protein RPM1 [Glycine soja]|uniref:Disease resistance protein RPM1 n=1 Tax=Glycine soja TaxID=3848 RepID=A0A0B2R2V2_GLYSO|nr:Disease resistance protein RPM1 [Glycine soja]